MLPMMIFSCGSTTFGWHPASESAITRIAAIKIYFFITSSPFWNFLNCFGIYQWNAKTNNPEQKFS
jgi:hypothetical protein